MSIKIPIALTVVMILLFQAALFCLVSEAEMERAYMIIFSKEFGYTLIGEKPVSIDEGVINNHFSANPDLVKEFVVSVKDELKDSNTIVFKAFLEEDGSHFLEMINKPALMNLVSHNQKLKDFIATNFRTEAEFYKQMEDPRLRIFDVLKNDAYLKGIVLGYGDANSSYFCRRCELLRHLRIFPFVRLVPQHEGLFFRQPNFPGRILYPYLARKVELGAGFSSFENEWRWMREVWWELRNEREAVPPFFIALPFYICRRGGDSEMVREKYKRASVKLVSNCINN